MPYKVRFLTPAAQPGTDPPQSGYSGLDAFVDEFTGHGGTKLGYSYEPYYAAGNAYLGTKATAAVNDAPMLDPTVTRVIVTGGSMATEAVRAAVTAAGAAAASIVIVQGVGGTKYDNTKSAYNNITGYHIDCLKTCQDTIGDITTAKISCLYDSLDTTSKAVHDQLVIPAGLTFYSLADLARNPALIDNSTFMMIPNANFYNNRATIVGYVDGRISTAGNVSAVYPEHEYKDASSQKPKVKVHGHNVQSTYRKAAHVTDKILRNLVSVGSLDPMIEADKDPPSLSKPKPKPKKPKPKKPKP